MKSQNIIKMISQREEFRFRLEKPSEIVKCLIELGINVSESDIANPEKNKELHQHIFVQLAEMCTGITREEMSQPVFKGLSALNYPELHEESTTNLNTFRACSKMMETCGIHSFTIKDFMSPDAKRSRKFLSGIINFLKFREERLGLLSELNSSRDALIERLNNTKEKGDIVANRLNKLKEQTAEDAQLISRIEEDINDIETQIRLLTQQETDARNDEQKFKSRSTQLKEEIVNKTLVLEETQQTKKSLTSQVVNSPERFRKRIVDAGNSLQNEQKEGKTAERRVRDLNAWLMNVDECQTEVDAALETMNDFKAEVDRQKNVVVELDNLKLLQETKKESLSEIEQMTQQMSRSVTRTEDKLNQLKKQALARSQENKQHIDNYHTQILHAEGIKAQLCGRAEKYELECVRLDREKEIEKSYMDEEIADMVKAYKQLERLVYEHLRKLTTSLQMSNTPVHSV